MKERAKDKVPDFETSDDGTRPRQEAWDNLSGGVEELEGEIAALSDEIMSADDGDNGQADPSLRPHRWPLTSAWPEFRPSPFHPKCIRRQNAQGVHEAS